MTATLLDKAYSQEVEDLGTMNIRVVVAPKRDGVAQAPADDELVIAVGKTPIDSYLERADGKGRMCVLFLVNGQRQDALDQTFVAKELGLRYLRNRTLILVELDGLQQRALNRLVKGDRVGFYRGDVFNTIRKRLIDTLERDPDLERLQSEAEEQVAALDSGTDAIQKKLDALIDERDAGEDPPTGPVPPDGPKTLAFGSPKMQTVVVQAGGSSPADGPVLTCASPQTIRMRPGTEHFVDVNALPHGAWDSMRALNFRVEPAIEELEIATSEIEGGGRRTSLRFVPKADADDDQYPIEAKVVVVAKFEGHEALRLVERSITIAPPRERPPPPQPPPLLSDPTKLAVATRQPVRLVLGGPTAHVRVRWNGMDELLNGPNAAWVVRARCTSLPKFPKINHSSARAGKFALLVDVPEGVTVGQELTFEVEAVGPGGKVLPAQFRGKIEALEPPDSPGTRKKRVPEVKEKPLRPYRLKFVGEDQWDATSYWNKSQWDGTSVASFVAPTKHDPLVLLLNKDFGPLRAFRDEQVSKGVLEASIEEKLTKYFTHVALHLYSMYQYRKKAESTPEAADDGPPPPTNTLDDFMQAEIERAGATVLQLL